jgi:hypothetical protein
MRAQAIIAKCHRIFRRLFAAKKPRNPTGYRLDYFVAERR